MKKEIMALFVVAALLSVPAFAQETDVSTVTEAELSAGLTPDSPLYGVDRAIERLQLRLTFNDLARARLHYMLARERLAEARDLSKKGNTELAEETLADYESELDDTDAETQTAIAQGEDATELTEEISSESPTHVLAMESMYNSYSDDKKELLRARMKRSLERHSKISERVDGTTVPIIITIGGQTFTIQVSEKVAAKMLERLEEQGNKRAIRAQLKEEKSGERLDKCEELIARAKEAELSEDGQELLANAEKHFASAQEALEAGKPGRAFGQATAACQLARNALKHVEKVEGVDGIDLTVSSVELIPTTVGEDGTVEIKAVVSNLGDESVPSFTVRVKDMTSDTVVSETVVDFVEDTAEVSVTAAYEHVAGAGEHTIAVVVDPENSIVEADETNNEATASFTIGSAETASRGSG